MHLIIWKSRKSMKNKLSINVKNFKYENDGISILTPFSVELESGNILWLSGDVGCGKTTLLKIIAGIIPNFESGILDGQIMLNNKIIGEKTFSDTTFCFQHPDNQLLFDSVKRQFFEDGKILYPFLKSVDLIQIANKSVMDLSRGQRKFVALMSTIRKKRKLYIFDEPLDLLDYKNKKKFFEEIQKISKNSIIIISSHNEEIKRIANMRMNYNKADGWKAINLSGRIKKKKLYRIPNKKSSDLVIKTEDLSFCFRGNNEKLYFSNIEIFRNEIIGLVGENGSGKTTFLRLLANSLEPSENDNAVCRKFNSYGFMFQNVNRQLFGNTVYEELLIGTKHGVKFQINSAIYLLEKLNLIKFKDLHPTFLSGGQKQKLVFASLIIHKPEILFLDEIFTNLDVESINTILRLISEYRNKNDLTVILTDQDTIYLKQVCDRTINI